MHGPNDHGPTHCFLGLLRPSWIY